MFKFFRGLFKRWTVYKLNDPVYSCEVYKSEGCSHIDGILCDMRTCNILINHHDKLADIEKIKNMISNELYADLKSLLIKHFKELG